MGKFGEKLRRLRGDRAQKDVARELGLPQTTLSSLEKQEGIPRGDLLRKLAEHYSVAIEYFYGSPPLESTTNAKNWLRQIREEEPLSGGLATHSTVEFSPDDKKTITDALIEAAKKSASGAK